MAEYNFKNGPFEAYDGTEPYIFISYKHADSDIVYPILKRFHDEGFNIWYDDGLKYGDDYDDLIDFKIDNSSLFLICITNRVIEGAYDPKEYMKKELDVAIDTETKMFPIFLDDVKLKGKYRMQLRGLHSIFKHEYGDDEDLFIQDCINAFKNDFGLVQNIRPEIELPEVKPAERIVKIKAENPKEKLLDDALIYDVLYSDVDSKSISKYMDTFFSQLELYDDFRNGHNYKDILNEAINVFLDNKNSYSAFEVYRTFFDIYQITSEDKSMAVKDNAYILNEPNTILELIEIIKKYWDENNDDFDKQRNIFVHSVNAFVLGLAIYCQNENYRKHFKEYVLSSRYGKYYRNGDNELSHEEFLYRWGITSLLHDIYYPLEMISIKKKRSLYHEFDSIFGGMLEDSDIENIFKIEPSFADSYKSSYPETKFLDLFNSKNLLAHKLFIDFPNLELNDLATELGSFTEFIKNSEFDEHGFISALLILKSYSYQIQKYAKDQSFFFYPILDSASAIFLHNYYHYFLQKHPFNLERLHPYNNPLAYLLILCDNILEFYKKSENIIDNRVNVIGNLKVNDISLEAEYDIKSNSYGFGFSNELDLYNILDISSIFKRGAYIEVDCDNSLINNDVSISDNYPTMNFSMNVLEKIAIGIHVHSFERILEGINEIPDFDDLPFETKMSTLNQAMLIPKMLNGAGYVMAMDNDENGKTIRFSDDEVAYMAKLEHDMWYEEKIGSGWTYGEKKDVENLVTPYLVPWNQLPCELQQKDIDYILTIPDILKSAGFKIYKK